MKFDVTKEHLQKLKNYLSWQHGHDYHNKLAMYLANGLGSQQIALLLKATDSTKKVRSSTWKMCKYVGVKSKSELREVCKQHFNMKNRKWEGVVDE